MGDWGTDPGVWYSTVREGGMEDKKTFEQRQRKIETEKADKVEVAPGLTVANLRHLKSRVDRTDPRTHQAASAVLIEKLETLK